MEIITNSKAFIKRSLATIMTVLIVISSSATVPAFAADKAFGKKSVGAAYGSITDGDADYGTIVDEGYCGYYDEEDLEWTLYEDGTLVISGEDYMADYHYISYEDEGYYVAPWLDTQYDEEAELYIATDNYTIRTVIIEEGVADIGAYAFYGCKALEKVYIPSSVEAFYEGTFMNCTALEEILLDEENENLFIAGNSLCYNYYDIWTETETATLGWYPIADESEVFTVPEGIDYVAYGVFSGSEHLKRVIVDNFDTVLDYIYDSSIEEIVAYPFSSTHDTAVACGIDFVPYDGIEVESIDIYPTVTEFEIDSELYDPYIEIYVTYSTGEEYPIYYYDFLYDFSQIGPATVEVISCAETIGEYEVNVRDKAFLAEGERTTFSFDADNCAYFYFTPEESGEYTFSWNYEDEAYICLEEYIYDEWFEEYWWETSEEAEFSVNDEKKISWYLEEGTEYRIFLGAYSFDDISDEEYTMSVVRDCQHDNVVSFGQQDPTCTASGYTAGKFCQDCESWIEGHIQIEAIRHIYTEEYVTDKAATCTSPGTKSKHCRICDIRTEEKKIFAHGHIMDDGVIIKSPTYTTVGIRLYCCTECKAVLKSGKIPKLTEKAKKLPVRVTGLKAEKQKLNSIKLAWDKVEGAEKYIVHYTVDGKLWGKSETKNHTLTLEGLKTGTKYKIKVAAVNADGEGEASELLTASTKPGRVKLKSAQSVKAKTALIKWAKVKRAKGYEILISTSGKFKKKATKTIVKDSSQRKLTVKKLKSGKKYYVKVRAFKKVNGKKLYGAYSKVKSFVVK